MYDTDALRASLADAAPTPMAPPSTTNDGRFVVSDHPPPPVGDQDPSPSASACVHDEGDIDADEEVGRRLPGKYLVMDLAAVVWGKRRQLRLYLPDVPAKMRFYWALLFLAGLGMVALGAITIVLVPDARWVGVVAMTDIVGDPLLALVNLMFSYGTYSSLAVQFLAGMFGALIRAAILLYAPFGYAATLVLVCVPNALCSPCFALIAQPRLFDTDDVLKRLGGSRWLPATYSLVPFSPTPMLTASEHMWTRQNRLMALVRNVDYMSDLAVGMGMVTRGVALWAGVSVLVLCQVDILSGIIAYGIRTRATLRQHASLFATSLCEVPILVLTVLYGARSTDLLTTIISIMATSSTILIKAVAVLNSVMVERLGATKTSMTGDVTPEPKPKTTTTPKTVSTEGPTEEEAEEDDRADAVLDLHTADI
ncbi:unnamed protein product [Vitrella brassicaformis CCMP3155]|uniref:Uncharacterized protein n=2 Tax=Vitrella brassicaformis TaxID=1169539 RepID=A0A0G4G8H2_VITBC|nr:unnamed protein product [Vitrella brassicaformis CCMP3155]|eukprot:CEM25131.1 unnamed protein product [Vitrella brassicaformis CCMP3155]